MEVGKLFELPPLPLSAEVTDILAQSAAVRVERIVSAGQTTDWYDQHESELVALLQGEAVLAWEGGEETRLHTGDVLTIPPHKRHRVSYTSSQPPCVWLCVFWE